MAYGGLLTIVTVSPARHSRSILSPVAGTNRRHSKVTTEEWSRGVISPRNRTILRVGSSDDHVNVGRVARNCPRLAQPNDVKHVECSDEPASCTTYRA